MGEECAQQEPENEDESEKKEKVVFGIFILHFPTTILFYEDLRAKCHSFNL
jgi:hypothetical protein